MRGTFVDKVTGIPIHQTKNGQDATSQRLRNEGHMFLEGEIDLRDRRLKWDFVAGMLVHDPRYEEWERDRTQAEEDARRAFVELRDFDASAVDWTIPNQVRMAFEYQRVRIVTLFRFIAKAIQ